jgi:MinD-like ATPase involved in chromosome partitioning or flagellar assembly
VGFGSVRSCGVTTLTVALAATWPAERRVLVVEADPAGGTLAGASGWPPEPSLVSLAAASRRGGDPSRAWEHCQQLPGGGEVLPGPASADQAHDALAMLGGLLGAFGELDADVLVDCGRLDSGSPVHGLWERADRAVLVARPRLADLQAVATWLETHPFAGGRLGLVTVGEGPYPDAEITEALGIEVLARVPWDPVAASGLMSVPASARELRLAPLVRAARTFADHLAADHAAMKPAAAQTPTAEGFVSVRARVWRAFRPDTATVSPNGTAPDQVSP